MECQECTLVQLKHSAPNDLLYSKHYWYKSGINQVIKDDLKEIADLAMEEMLPGDTIIDIGANDGTLLSFIPDEIEKVGVEPADNLQEELSKHADVTIHDFWKYDNYSGNKATVITAIGMFYDLEDPIAFLSDARKALDKDGVFIAQLMCAKQMAENRDIGNLCHEHLEFYTLKSLQYLFEKSGLEIFDIKENSINGGSYRVMARHKGDKELSIPTEKPIDWDKFVRDIEEQRWRTVEAIQEALDMNLKVYAYGASTKGNTILQYFGLTADDIEGVADKDREKWGRYMLNGSPIVSEEEARDRADVFLILPYAFTDTFVKREREWLSEPINYFIQPLPKINFIYDTPQHLQGNSE